MEERYTGKKKNMGFSVMGSSSSGTSKRSRAHSYGNQVASCLVDGCNSDLSKCRDYHRRHKVCELHSKTPKVTIGGQEQRFCQQCSRFHSLIEFDEGKRSCRKRLDGHNRRRRKPQPEAMPLNSGRFLSSYQDSRFFPFGIPQIFSTSAAVSSVWVGTVKAENDTSSQSLLSFTDRRKSSSPASLIPSYKGKQFPFLHSSNPAIPGASICQSLLEPSYRSDDCGSGQKVYSDGLNRVIDSDPARALSLLSTPAETREICFSSMVQHSLNPPVQSLMPNVHYSSLGMEDKDFNSALISDESRNTNNIQQCQGTFQIGPDGSSSSGPTRHSRSGSNAMPSEFVPEVEEPSVLGGYSGKFVF